MAEKYPDLVGTQTLGEAMQVLQPALVSIFTQLASLTDSMVTFTASQKATDSKIDVVGSRLEKKMTDVISSLHHTQAEVVSLKTRVIPDIVAHIARVQTATIITQLAQDVWARKWNVMVFGVRGPAGEPQEATEAAVLDWAKINLGVTTSPEQLMAAHRLDKSKADAGIIVRFTSLPMAEAWVSAATRKGKTLKQMRPKVSVIQDLPPVLRASRNSLLAKRQQLLKDGVAEKAYVRHLAKWPFCQLVVQEKATAAGTPGRRQYHEPDQSLYSKESIAALYVGVADIEADVPCDISNALPQSPVAQPAPPPPAVQLATPPAVQLATPPAAQLTTPPAAQLGAPVSTPAPVPTVSSQTGAPLAPAAPALHAAVAQQPMTSLEKLHAGMVDMPPGYQALMEQQRQPPAPDASAESDEESDSGATASQQDLRTKKKRERETRQSAGQARKGARSKPGPT